MSEYGMEGPLEQETNSTKANTRANDKWAQKGIHGPKWKVGGPTGRPADLPVGPTTFRFHVEVSHWLLMAV